MQGISAEQVSSYLFPKIYDDDEDDDDDGIWHVIVCWFLAHDLKIGILPLNILLLTWRDFIFIRLWVQSVFSDYKEEHEKDYELQKKLGSQILCIFKNCARQKRTSKVT